MVAFATDELSAAVQVFHVRGGRVRGQRGWVVDKARRRTRTGELVEQFVAQINGLVEQFVLQFYGEDDAVIPREVLVPELPEDHEALAELLQRAARQPGVAAGAAARRQAGADADRAAQRRAGVPAVQAAPGQST